MPIEGRREEIIKAAIKAFAEKGYENISIAGIAKLSKIPQPSIYRICKSKENILLQIYEIFWQDFLEDIRGVAESKWEESVVEKLRKIFLVAQNFISQKIDLMRIIATTSLLPPEKIKDIELKERRLNIRAKNREMLKLIDSVISDGQKNKEIIGELKPQVIRQILMGSFQILAYGLFIQFSRNEDVGYTIIEAKRGIDYLLNSFIRKSSID